MLSINVHTLNFCFPHCKAICVVGRLNASLRLCQHLEVCMRSPAIYIIWRWEELQVAK
uniref:Uncharacterized protein n=1 Tax=Rhizophora mucronata TaxID=61149 RepID=A0A2P2NUI1_RHIMU